MKYISFPGAGRLAGLANMLECLGINTEDHEIARAMELPYLFVHEDGQYYAGARLFQPKWLNLYLHPIGYHMMEQDIPSGEICAFLRSAPTAMLSLRVSKENVHPVVFTGYTNGRYLFTNIKAGNSQEPDTLSLSAAMLRNRLPSTVTVSTLSACTPQPTDLQPLLLKSLANLSKYRHDVLSARLQTVSREELAIVKDRLFRALMQDLLPLIPLTEDFELAEELRLLNHDYRHIVTLNSPEYIVLNETLPKTPIITCINWLRENVIDRLYALEPDHEALDAYLYGTHS